MPRWLYSINKNTLSVVFHAVLWAQGHCSVGLCVYRRPCGVCVYTSHVSQLTGSVAQLQPGQMTFLSVLRASIFSLWLSGTIRLWVTGCLWTVLLLCLVLAHHMCSGLSEPLFFITVFSSGQPSKTCGNRLHVMSTIPCKKFSVTASYNICLRCVEERKTPFLTVLSGCSLTDCVDVAFIVTHHILLIHALMHMHTDVQICPSQHKQSEYKAQTFVCINHIKGSGFGIENRFWIESKIFYN